MGKREVKYIASKVSKGLRDPGVDGSWTTRGLEGRTKEGYKTKCGNRRASWAAVFLEQNQQDIRGLEKNPEFIAGVYREKTSHSQLLAIAMGNLDANAAK